MSNRIRAPFPWFGGKGAFTIKEAILKSLPPHTHYVEPFGGGASILMSKDQSEVEVYNDVNRGVVNFFSRDRRSGLLRKVHVSGCAVAGKQGNV